MHRKHYLCKQFAKNIWSFANIFTNRLRLIICDVFAFALKLQIYRKYCKDIDHPLAIGFCKKSNGLCDL
jgi:hypothetical protein